MEISITRLLVISINDNTTYKVYFNSNNSVTEIYFCEDSKETLLNELDSFEIIQMYKLSDFLHA